ncbi:MAG TPA: SpvB/TcaC N-terminal domain-containing protein, partial [Jatrophihabitans sp.]|nr:SpvB/TcaC N-terminal domain-containing protein [Jatrophihabitans sp.]
SSVFGTDPSSRLADPDAPERVFGWLLQETFDARGNHVVHDYKPEDGVGVPAGRSLAARYPSRTCWANAEAYGPSMMLTLTSQQRAALGWHFQLLWNYGEYAEDGQPVGTPVADWALRPDPFSTYQAGFEIRYYRRCQSLLVLHHFPAELGPLPVLTGALRLRYDSDPFASRLIRAEQAGFRTDDGQRRAASLAPIEFGWSDFDQDGGGYRELDFGTGQPPTVLPGAELHWVDLDGVGIPGVLLAAGDGLRFWQPAAIDPQDGTVRYSGPRTIGAAPLGAAGDDGAAAYTLVDVTGAGRPQWLGTIAGVAGYAEVGIAGDPGSSGPLQFFDAFPTDYTDPLAEQINVTGTGLADLVLIGASEVAWTPSLGAAGYGPRQLTPGTGLPPVTPSEPGEVRQFADVLGSGQQHYVRIRNGSVTCWPNLGFGRFGAAIELADAPFLEPDFDPARLFVLDLDGSGAADLAYRYPWQVRIWRNRSGNGFAEPLDIPLPAGADSAALVDFADLLGTGISCLVVTQPGPQSRHWAYVFGDGAKPYLLTDIDNGLGQQSTIQYSTSAQQHLTDPDPGPAELGVPPFPVHVTVRVQHHDLLAASTSVSTWRYRHGYYDADECSFTGFGLVERQDSELTEDGSSTPPLLVRSWFHNGAAPATGSVESLYRAEYFDGDPDSYPLPESALDLPAGSGAEGVRQALYSLAGKLLHEETYGLDGSALQPLPYQVTGIRYQCTVLSPLGNGGNPASFFCRPLEAIDYDYERNPADPRVAHTFTLAVDGYGNPTSQCVLHYPRRPAIPGPSAQAQLLATLTTSVYLNVDDPFRLLGVPADQRESQLGGLSVPTGGYFDLAALTRQLPAATSTLTGWLRYAYVPDPAGAALAPQRLLVALEQAEHDRTLLEQAYDQVLTPAELVTLLTDLGPTGGALRAGTGDAAPWWWNPGEQRGYAGSDGFYRPRTSQDAFGYTVTATDDAYCLLVASVSDPLGNTTTAEVDYQAMDYCRITDPNGSVAEAGFDPLAIVQVSTMHGSEGGQAVGFGPLSGWQLPPEQPSVAEVLADPAGYLQQAAAAFCYDPLAWTGSVPPTAFDRLGVATAALWSELEDRGYLSPAGAICPPFRQAVARQDFELGTEFAAVAGQVRDIIAAQPSGAPVRGLLLSASAFPDAGTDAIVFRLAYYDGWQRLLQAKLRSDPADTDRAWLT